MGTSAQELDLWKQIDNAEYYLVGGSFEQAVSIASSVADQIRDVALQDVCDDGFAEMLEVAGMVIVQALKELKRTSEMFVQLKTMYGSVASIPAKVFLTGASMQMAEGSGSDLKPMFQEYLAKWRYTDDRVYVFNGEQDSSSNSFIGTSVMPAEQYLEVAEMYTITSLALSPMRPKLLSLGAEKAELAEPDRQDLLKKLQALQSAANEKSSTALGPKQAAERNASMNSSTTLLHEDAPKSSVPEYSGKVDRLKESLLKSTKPSLQRVTKQFDPFVWWFHSVRIKFGKVHIVIPSGKLMLLFSLLFSSLLLLRKKSSGLKRHAFQQVSSLRRAFVDALQLAFSVQMNPLAAVQQLPQASLGR